MLLEKRPGRAFAALLLGGALLPLTGAEPYAQTKVGQETPGWYLGLGAGANWQENNKLSGGGTSGSVSFGTGWAALGSLGYGLGNGLRLEAEGGFRRNSVDRAGGVTGDGRSTILTMMANGIYDLGIQLPFLEITPHVGAGVGWAHIWHRASPVGPGGLTLSGSTDRPAVQAIAGVDLGPLLGDRFGPAVKVGLDYRYLLVPNARFNTTSGSSTRAGDFNDHTVLLTFRYQFGGARTTPPPVTPAAVTPPPPPPRPPAAAVPAPQTFTVYFATDSAALTPEARRVVDAAAGNAGQNRVTSIAITGYTDTTGASAHNQRLSQRRAASVRDELVRQGVPANEISVQGLGESDLAVPTADHVNEPRNRRVVIVLQGPGT